jgi:hypothetical protein
MLQELLLAKIRQHLLEFRIRARK